MGACPSSKIHHWVKIRKNRPNRFRDFGAIKAQIPRLNLIVESFVAKIDCQRKQGNNKSHFFHFEQIALCGVSTTSELDLDDTMILVG